MWKLYSLSHIRHNRASSLGIAGCTLAACLLITCLCLVFYNIWADEVRRVILTEGPAHAVLTGDFSDETVEAIERRPEVKSVTRSAGQTPALNIELNNMRETYKVMPELAGLAGVPADSGFLVYHDRLLSAYLVPTPQGLSVRSLMVIGYMGAVLLCCATLILMLKNAFFVSMSSRLHQLGILESVGATPKQLRQALYSECAILCLPAVALGLGLGVLASWGFVGYLASVANPINQVDLQYQFSFWAMGAALLATLITVWLSAVIPARRLSRISALEAIRSGVQRPVKKMRRYRVFSRLFGVEAELARKSIYARKRLLRAAAWSLTLAFLGLCAFLNVEAISGLSTQRTYFERYRSRWDLMAALTESGDDSRILGQIRSIPGVERATAYRMTVARARVDGTLLSGEVKALEDPSSLSERLVPDERGALWLKAPVLVLDDQSFLGYCAENGISPGESGALIVNRIANGERDEAHNRLYWPYLTEETGLSLPLYESGRKDEPFATLEIAGFVSELPELRQEFEEDALVVVMSESLYDSMKDRFPAPYAAALEKVPLNPTEHFSIRNRVYNVIAESEQEIEGIQDQLSALLPQGTIIENRLAAQRDDATMRWGIRVIISALACLLALIGLSSVFAVCLSQIQQRRREFARYLSVGLSPGGMVKILVMEGLLMGLKPLLIGLVVNIPLTALMLNAAWISVPAYLSSAPVGFILGFMALVLVMVGLASYLGGRKILRGNLMEALKDDAL